MNAGHSRVLSLHSSSYGNFHILHTLSLYICIGASQKNFSGCLKTQCFVVVLVHVNAGYIVCVNAYINYMALTYMLYITTFMAVFT